jgi:hypothetical protein
MSLVDNPDIRLFWQASALSAGLGLLLVGLFCPSEWLYYVAGAGLGGLYWSTVARRTDWITRQTAITQKQKFMAISLGLLTVLGLAAGIGLMAIKHPIVFVGLFIYKLGIVACFLRSSQ